MFGKKEKQSALVTLTAQNAKNNDVFKFKARFNSKVMKQLGVSPGDIVELIGNKRAAARVWPAYPEDSDRDTIRIDKITRQNLDVNVGDKIQVRKIRAVAAEKVVLIDVQSKIYISNMRISWMKRNLLGIPVRVGNHFATQYIGKQPYEFYVEKTEPEGFVYITDITEIELIQRKELQSTAIESVLANFEKLRNSKHSTLNHVDHIYLAKLCMLGPADVMDIMIKLIEEGRISGYKSRQTGLRYYQVIWVPVNEEDNPWFDKPLYGTPYPEDPSLPSIQAYPVFDLNNLNENITENSDLILCIGPSENKMYQKLFNTILEPTISRLPGGFRTELLDHGLMNSDIDQLWKLIFSSRLLIFDLSEPNPLIFYALGLADAYGKKSILMVQDDYWSTEINRHAEREIVIYSMSSRIFTIDENYVKSIIEKAL